MSLKDLFSNINASIIASGTLIEIADETESVDYLESYLKRRDKLRTHVDFSQPENFAKFGSAEKYYGDSIQRIYNTYPYDGSRYEKVQFQLSSSDLDRYIFENDYPRRNGYVAFSADGWTNQLSTTDGYGVPSTKQYIFIKGGPNTSRRLKGTGIDNSSGDYRSGFANVYDLAKDRDSNLRIDGVEGNTVEFFLKKEEFDTSLTEKEVLFDAFTTIYDPGSTGYGRLRVTLTGSDGVPFLVTYQSGTDGFEDQLLGQSITTASVADGYWHHYAITLKNLESQVQAKLYVDGNCNHTINLGTSINYVSGNFNATIGALGAKTGSLPDSILGDGKLSASIDEFRFWKTQRSSLQVNRYMREQVGGGTNTDDANVALGVYYKFNEGITQTASIDKTILDYSGRISNGTFTGYNTSVRNIGSAFVSSSLAAFEFKDPILYSFHPAVKALQSSKEAIGLEYDYTNPNSIYHGMPSWIIECEGDKVHPPLKNLTQILSSYFDTLYNQIENLSKLKHINYTSGSADFDDKPYFFNNRILEGMGFPYVPDLFQDATFFEFFMNRDDQRLFEEKLYDVKNTIYRNIYNNLAYINKTKGTEKAFRNTLRCFGVDDEVYKIRYYATDAAYEYRDNYKAIVENKNYVNFALTGTSAATVYQYQTDTNTTSLISSSFGASSGFGFTVEAQAIFPIFQPESVRGTTINSSDRRTVTVVKDFVEDIETSIYGSRTAIAVENDLTVPANDRSGFVVNVVRSKEFGERAYFKLAPTDATSFIPTITSSYFDDVFDNTKWNFAVTVKPTKYGQLDFITGSADDATYDVVFQGINTVLDEVRDSFELSSTISKANGLTVVTGSKRVFVGALRENLSGSLTTRSNAFITDCRFWLAPLSFTDIKKHSIDFENYGIEKPYNSAYLFQTGTVTMDVRVPNIETLALNWNFVNLTSSNSNGQFEVVDISSGSSTDDRFGILSNTLSRQHSGRGDHFLPSNAACFTKKDVYNARTQLPEYVNSYDMIRISNQDDVTFTRSTRPTNFLIAIEKSMYQTVSEEMIKIFSTIADYGSLVGNLVNRYRFENKELTKLRQMFFENVSNTPKLEAYLEYYKWLDSSLNVLLANLIPATAITHDSQNIIRPMVEEYVFNRNRYTSKFPTLEFKQNKIEGVAQQWTGGSLVFNQQKKADNTLNPPAGQYSVHAPNLPESPMPTNKHCAWWKTRAERTTPEISSGDAEVDANRDVIRIVLENSNDAPPPVLGDSEGTYQGSTYATRQFTILLTPSAQLQRNIHGGPTFSKNKKIGFWDSIRRRPTPIGASEGAVIAINNSSGSALESFGECIDNLDLNGGKRKYSFSVQTSTDGAALTIANKFKGNLIFPFSLYSSSITNLALGDVADFQSNLDITNLHNDTYGPYNDVPMQGPFTEKYVGGRAYRHVFTNFSLNKTNLDSQGERLEGWILSASSGQLVLKNPEAPRSVYFRNCLAKRPVNIANIRQLTGAAITGDQFTNPSGTTVIGNYSKDYEVIMAGGRSVNNRLLVKSEGVLLTGSSDSTYIDGLIDFTLLRRDLTGSNNYIIASRFSAPGDPATMGPGALDVAAGVFSVYNALPFRNLSVRQPLNELYSDHTNQFGYFSDAFTVAAYDLADETYPGGNSSVNANDYSGTGSYHKTNRNTRLTIAFSGSTGYGDSNYITKSTYDNWFVQHQIPQTDIQYSWITASLINNYSGSALYWFEQPDFSNASLASTDITFVSASDSGSGDIKVDFAGMSTLILDDVNSSLNLLSSSDYFNTNIASLETVLETNALTLHRGGPYGGANWKLYRKSSNPIVRAHRTENRLSFLKYDRLVDSESLMPKPRRQIVSVIEPPINSKYRPILFDLAIKTSDGVCGKNMQLKQSYLNNFVKFSDKIENNYDLNNGGFFNFIQGYGPKKLSYDALTALITEDVVLSGTNPINDVNSLTTYEVIYPREKFTYLSTHRQRENYVNDYWRDNRQVRSEIGSANLDPFLPDISTTYIYGAFDVITGEGFGLGISSSIWPLDGRVDFDTGPVPRIMSKAEKDAANSFSANVQAFLSTSIDKPGILQNSVSIYDNNIRMVNSIANAPAGWTVFSISILPLYNRRIAGALSSDATHEYKFGDTKWEAAEQSGIKPFYDTYSDYIEDAKRIGKDYSIIPEFRISEHMDYYLNTKSGDFLADNASSFSITGATPQNSGGNDFMVTYSHTDFLKTFNLVNNDYNDKLTPKTIDLECEGIIKFLPYDGFYPADRTVQITKLFWDSYSSSFAITGTIIQENRVVFSDTGQINIGDTVSEFKSSVISPIWKPLFAPGILYNSIKSGIAVDYPVHTSASAPLLVSGSPNQRNGLGYLIDIPRIATPFDYRIPFEALVDPEGIIGGVNIIDSEPHPSASLDVTASLAVAGKSNYKLAMHNFLASTIDFFNPNGELTTISSLSDNDPNFGLDESGKGLQIGKEYTMKIILGNAKISTTTGYNAIYNENRELIFSGASYNWNPRRLVMYAQTGSDPQAHADYYGSAFGPPTFNSSTLNSDIYGPSSDPLYGSASYEPFTPPYYDGGATIEVSYTPQNQGESLATIVQNLTATFQRHSTGYPIYDEDAVATTDRMGLSASLNWKQLISVPGVVLDANGQVLQIEPNSLDKGTKLVIQPKWETPVLNFKDVAVTLPVTGSGSVARGMWHQYGLLPKGDEGIYMGIHDMIDVEKADPTMTGSLRHVLGFNVTTPNLGVPIGQIAEQKTISEAIIAVPHILLNPGDEDTSNKTRFMIERQTIDLVIDFLDNGKTEKYIQMVEKKPELEPSEEIIDMVKKMRKYVIPPKFDFLTNKQLKPFAMFIMEFSVNLTQQDLANIWQNLTPEIGTSAQKAKATLPANIFNSDTSEKTLLNEIPDDIQWQVFKVKQKSAWNYFDKTAQAEGQNLIMPNYSYNWPYDFFSLVELAKINANGTFVKKDGTYKCDL